MSEPGSYRLHGTVSVPAGFRLADGVSSTIYASYSISSAMSGIVDVVFVIDTTASMSDEISGVKSSVKEFADSLYATGLSVRWALVEYQDITCDGLGSTRVVMNGADPWYADVDAYKSAIGGLVLGYGEDEPETVIDGLEAARHLSFRDSAGRIFVVVTDAGYKADNQYGVPDMASEISYLKSDGISVFVVTSAGCYADYRDLADSTGGKLLDIGGDFSDGLMEVAERIGESGIVSIRIVSLPDVTDYFVGEAFDPAGMVVEAVYGNGAVRQVSFYTVEPSGPLSAGVSHVTIHIGAVTADVPVTVRAATVSKGDVFAYNGLEYTVGSIRPGEVSVTGCSGSPSRVTIPSEVGYKGFSFSVVSVASKAFYGCATLVYLDLGAVQEVGFKAFANCSKLKTLVVSDTVKVFGSYAFYGCGIESLEIPGDGVVLEASAFSACKKMTSIAFSGAGAVIGTNAFYKNNGVSTVDLSTVASVGFKAFPYCYGLETLVIPGTLGSMGAYAFYRCDGLKTLVVEEGVESIPASAFSGCKSIETVSFPSTLKSVGANAFHGVKFIGADGKSLDPAAENLRGHVFAKSGTSLRMSSLLEGDEFCVGGIVYRVTSLVGHSVSIVGHEGDVTAVPSSVAFAKMEFRVTTVEEKAFYGCAAIASVDLSHAVSIGMKAFANCSGITEITFGPDLESVGGYAFYGLSFKDSDGSSVGTADGFRGHTFFKSGKSLLMAGELLDGEEFTYLGLVCKVASVSGRTVSVIGYSGSVTSVLSVVSYKGWDLSVVSVEQKAFYNCSTLVHVDLSSVTSIGLKAFAGCSGITDIVFGPGLETVKDYAFTGLRFFGEDDAPMYAAADAFRGHSFHGDAKSLRMFSEIHDGDVFVCAGIVYKVTSATECTVSITGNDGTAVSVPSSVSFKGWDLAVTSVAQKAFYNCVTIVSVDLSNVASIGLKAFANCSGMTEITFGPGLESIGDYAFYGVSFGDYDGVSIGVSVETVHGHAFHKSGDVLRMYWTTVGGEQFTVGGVIYKVTSAGSPSVSAIGFEGSVAILPASVSYRGWDFVVESVESYAFYECTTLVHVDLSNVKSIGLKAFAKCSGIADIVFGPGLETVKDYAFAGLSFCDEDGDPVSAEDFRGNSFHRSGKVLRMFSGLEDGEEFASGGIQYKVVSASGCTASMTGRSGSVTSVPSTVSYKGWDLSVVSVGARAFYGCSSLESVDLSNVRTVGSGAFSGCAGIEEIVFGPSLESIGADALLGLALYDGDGNPVEPTAENLRGHSFHMAGGVLRMFWKLQGGEQFTSGGVVYKVAVAGSDAVSVIGYDGAAASLPSSVYYKGWDLSVESVAKEAFYGCATLTSVDLSNVKSIGTKAFAKCYGIEEVVFGPGLDKVADYAFYGLSFCDGSGNPVSAASELRGHSFHRSGGVLRMYWEIHDGDSFTAGGVQYKVSSAAGCTVSATGFKGSVRSLPSSVVYKGWDLAVASVGDSAFYGCSTISSADLSNAVSVGFKAFANCSGLYEVRFGGCLESVGDYAFYGQTFRDDDGRTVSSAEDLRGSSFHKSGGVLRMFWDIDVGEEFTVGGIDYEVASVAEGAVSITGCSGDVTAVPSSVSYKGWDLAVRSVGSKAFYGCATLTSADLSNVRTIGAKAFANCSGLSEVRFGGCLESVGDYAFHGLSFYSGGEKIEVIPSVLKGESFSGSGGKLYREF
ncbi:MAG: leucine-rich repeat protein [Candidatus Methanomethylophilaceae archaeon]|nr:leucine-rich repeat protein [Candidatus Methanomethylophilaceae archaeon]